MAKKPGDRFLRAILIGTLTVVTLFCLVVVIWRITVDVDAKRCRARLAVEYHVEPTYSAVGNAILARIRAESGPDMKRDNILALMEQIGPIMIHDETRFHYSDGEIKEMISLNACNSVWNEFDYFMIYTNEGQVLEILLYLND